MGRILLIAAGVTLVVMVVLVAALRLLTPDGREAPSRPQATVAATATPALVVTTAASATPETGASEAGAAGAGGEPATPKPTLTPASSPTWRVAGTLSGSGHRKGRVFRLRGDEQKLVWKLAGSNPVALIDVIKGDIAWWEDGGGREASPAIPGRGSTLLRLKRGEYYIYVFSTAGTWEVAVWDRR